jgi:hypothetical protein
MAFSTLRRPEAEAKKRSMLKDVKDERALQEICRKRSDNGPPFPALSG